MNGEVMSPEARAFLAEYGGLPQDRTARDNYTAFRFGFQAGEREGRRKAFAELAAMATKKADAS